MLHLKKQKLVYTYDAEAIVVIDKVPDRLLEIDGETMVVAISIELTRRLIEEKNISCYRFNESGIELTDKETKQINEAVEQAVDAERSFANKKLSIFYHQRYGTH